MQTPTARLLELLELLQARPLTTGREISIRLDIDARTVRRYVAALQELGVRVVVAAEQWAKACIADRHAEISEL